MFLVPCCDVSIISVLKRSSVRLCPLLFCMRFLFLFMLLVFIYAYWCPTRIPYQMMHRFTVFIMKTADVTSGTGAKDPSGPHEFTPGH